jgi:hypothetical protein
MFWRVSYSPDGSVMECRKLESEAVTPTLMGGFASAKIGELYHSHDASRGGLLRESGYPAFGNGLPAWKVIGVDSVGYSGPANVGYKVTASEVSHPFFTSPENVGAVANVAIGAGAVHHEWDVTLEAIPGVGKPTGNEDDKPKQLARAEVTTAGRYVDYRCDDVRCPPGDPCATPPTSPTPFVISEMIDWQRAAGGRVFAAGAIAVGSKLGTDPQVAALARNVLHHFGVKQRVDLFVVTSDGRVRWRWYDGGSNWSPTTDWHDTIGGSVQGRLQAVYWSPNVISILGFNAQGNLLYKYLDNGAFQPTTQFTNFGGSFTGRPAAVGFARNRLNIYARGTDNIISALWWDGSSWSAWNSIGPTTMSSDPAAVAFQGNRIALAAIDTNNHIRYKLWDGSAWTPSSTWTDDGRDCKFAPTWVAWGGNKLNLFVVDRVTSKLFTKHYDGQAWVPTWWDLGGAHNSRPVAVAYGSNKFSVFTVGTNGKMQVKWFDGSGWSAWTDLGGSFSGEPTAAVWRGNYVSVMGVSSAGAVQYKYTDGYSWFPSLTGWTPITGTLSGVRVSPIMTSWISS